MDVEKRNRIKAFLKEGVREGVFPGAVLIAAQGGGVEIFEEAGNRSLSLHAAPMTKGTVFDLASLTKPLGTTLAIMKLVNVAAGAASGDGAVFRSS